MTSHSHPSFAKNKPSILEQQAKESGFVGSGWSFPPTFSAGSYQLNMVQKQAILNKSIDSILQTRRGERCLNPGFGSILHSFVFRAFNASLQGEIIEAVRVALRDNEPRIKVDEVTVSANNSEGTHLFIKVTYTIRQTNNRFNHVYPFALTEATGLTHNYGGQ